MTTTTTTETTTETTTTVMSVEAAEAITNEVREAGKQLANARNKFAKAVKSAKAGSAHIALGYESWTAYIATVFADLKGLSKDDKEYLTAFMAAEGMPSRALAKVLGISQSTAARWVRVAVANGDVDADRKVVGEDGVEQSTGKNKGRKAGKKSPKAPATVAQASTNELATLLNRIIDELSDRWFEGDQAAEMALSDARDALTLAE